ncbi:hypothetical protein ARMGADRAFT_618947 [Armillaria gallica]|uniref:Uncharacterized protein n=1 Tax=Armillaria gallica TaxID=47427 RepID=A0A2H3D6Z8_ARMGA|nr:hypothetical protein ARMGADRAFT_618947 [Armillaria gallica]
MEIPARPLSNQNSGLSISSLTNRSTFLDTSTSKTGSTCSVIHGTLGLELQVVPLHVDPPVEDTRMRNASTRESSKTFLDNVQQGPSVSVVDMEAYGKALKVFQKTHGCPVDSWLEEWYIQWTIQDDSVADISVAVGIPTPTPS